MRALALDLLAALVCAPAAALLAPLAWGAASLGPAWAAPLAALALWRALVALLHEGARWVGRNLLPEDAPRLA